MWLDNKSVAAMTLVFLPMSLELTRAAWVRTKRPESIDSEPKWIDDRPMWRKCVDFIAIALSLVRPLRGNGFCRGQKTSRPGPLCLYSPGPGLPSSSLRN